MRVEGPCLTLQIAKGTSDAAILPIWPTGFTAKGDESEGVLLTGSLGTAHDALISERLQLHGQFLDEPPADTTVPAACGDYHLFLVGRALNIQM